MVWVVQYFVGVILICSTYAVVPFLGMGGFDRIKNMGFGGRGMGVGGMKLLGGSEESGSNFGEGKKIFDDMFFKKGFGSEGMSFGMGNSGFGQNQGLIKNLKGDMGFYSGSQGGKNLAEDGKAYFGGQFFGNEGKKLNEAKADQAHKKGRTVKGFHTTHESNEASKSEEVYDEEHDEADKKAIALAAGKFGENKEKAYKGEKADSKFMSDADKKEGQFKNSISAGKANAGQEQYGGKKYGTDGSSYGLAAEGDIVGNSGHNQANKMFKHFKI